MQACCPLTRHAVYTPTAGHIHIAFTRPHRVLSSAVLNGGMTVADHLINLKVPKRSVPKEAPASTIAEYGRRQGWAGTVVGMMTAASMDSLRITQESALGVDIRVLVTAGLSNPRRVGDRADHRRMTSESHTAGTINIIAITSTTLTDAAMAEALMLVTEAKTAALHAAGVRSPISNAMATGTGTDAVAIISGHGQDGVRYCGKHVLFGEILGRLATDAIQSAIAWDIARAQSGVPRPVPSGGTRSTAKG